LPLRLELSSFLKQNSFQKTRNHAEQQLAECVAALVSKGTAIHMA